MARGPFAKLDDHFISWHGRTANIGWGRHINILRDTGVIGNHVEELSAGLESAYQAGSGALENAHHPASRWLLRARDSARRGIAPDQNPVSVHGCSCGITGNANGGKARIGWLQHSPALAIDPDPAGDKVGLKRQPETVPLLEPGDLACALHAREGLVEDL